MLLIVVGGKDASGTSLTSTEVLDLQSMNEWRAGPDFPVPISKSGILESNDRKSVMIVGGWNAKTNAPERSLYQLDDVSGDWKLLNYSLVEARQYPLVTKLPKRLTSCEDGNVIAYL